MNKFKAPKLRFFPGDILQNKSATQFTILGCCRYEDKPTVWRFILCEGNHIIERPSIRIDYSIRPMNQSFSNEILQTAELPGSTFYITNQQALNDYKRIRQQYINI